MTFEHLISADVPDVQAIAIHLDGLDPTARLAAVARLTRRQQGRLFDAVDDFLPLSLDDFVPASMPRLVEVVHEGNNGLPAFRRFAKVFCRPDECTGAGDELWGYNRNSWLVETAVGPGYFVAYVEKPGEVLIDYHHVPPRSIPGWPPVLPNSARLGRFVYHRMQDVVRKVSAHVSVGRVRRGGRMYDQWFVLCRQG